MIGMLIGDPPFLWRLNLVYRKRFSVKLHRFLRSDPDRDLHDHPWNFVSIILWGGYYEETNAGTAWYGPGSILRRKATHRHRVILAERVCGKCRDCRYRALRLRELVESRKTAGCLDGVTVSPVSLIFTTGKLREWGFSTPRGWLHHRLYEHENCRPPKTKGGSGDQA